ncbi:hypothetical protein HH213_23815 [Duganella dendranthematis]|uniref:Pilus assembly protein n=1 Tax=Duganella dendranthematis TaxID=2728021 RepID=A0ABX6MET3_9BURK|nr:hypothetical protein [Duganella dendranthematis]QJD92845.1 hypothetical protein HH213_23815 [Duganella dendranthematis]
MKTARCDGQALAEFLVLAAALVPLYLLLPVIAKYQDVASQVAMASRYVTFEAMTRNDVQSSWKTPAELAGEVRRRFFGNADAPIKTGDVAGNFLAHQNLFWRGPDGAALIADFNSDVAVSFGPDQKATHDDGFTPLTTASRSTASWPARSAFTLRRSWALRAAESTPRTSRSAWPICRPD